MGRLEEDLGWLAAFVGLLLLVELADHTAELEAVAAADELGEGDGEGLGLGLLLAGAVKRLVSPGVAVKVSCHWPLIGIKLRPTAQALRVITGKASPVAGTTCNVSPALLSRLPLQFTWPKPPAGRESEKVLLPPL